MPYPKIDAGHLKVWPLSQRRSLATIEDTMLDPASPPPKLEAALADQIRRVAERIRQAREKNAAVMLAYGAHLVKNGAGPLVNALVDRGLVTHLATQGAGVIHDWEFAFAGRSTESVRENAAAGCFGSWDETGRWINLAVIGGAAEGLGFGEAVGRLIAQDGLALPSPAELRARIVSEPDHELTAARADLLWTIERFDVPTGRLDVPHPYKSYSILARAYQRRVPLTVHPGIGYDIIVNHPMYHGGAMGRAAGTDARVFAQSVDGLDGGVYLSIGSAIMSPQVFEKAFSAVNNLRRQQGRLPVRDHCLVIVDLQSGGGWDWSQGEPPKDNPAYYLRFCKSFHRMGGTLEYVRCDNRDFLAAVLSAK